MVVFIPFAPECVIQYHLEVQTVRIISGKWKGTPLYTPPGRETRPTGDRVKEALFSMIGPYFEGGVCLDLFAGSGALGLEALSRGMDFAVLVDRKSGDTIKRNVDRLNASANVKILPFHYEKVIKQLAGAYVFDLVFLDPPYALGLLPSVMATLVERRLLRNKAIVVAEMERNTISPAVPSLELVKCQDYGVTRVCIYQMTGHHEGEWEARR